ncbi:MAG: acyltransferase [Bradyrhizobium sp.]|uniref:acyltransferase family protein n=1 Tax=Bradyrhizobium sp. TaxID=376 RepID=UPI001D6C7976|nr:acyltransferase [Bradyrhizobium sp.]MBV9561737.1 acyltransferase [Bradyrhizobium sp.]
MTDGSIETSTAAMKADHRHYIGLDLLRLFAAFLVVFNHFGIFSAARPDVGAPFAFPALNFASDFGWVGVEIFFVISGFVIPLTASGATAGAFVKRRVIRVFPALWICTFLGFAVLVASGQPAQELLLPLLHSLILSPKGPYIDGVVWTLVVEAVFYALIWAALMSGTIERIGRIGAGLGLVSAIFLIFYGFTKLFSHDPAIGELSSALDRFTFRVLLLRHGVFFALGLLIWAGHTSGYSRVQRLLIAVMAIFGVLEISFQYWSTATVPSVQAMAIPILLWAASVAILMASIRFAKQLSDRFRDHRNLLVKLGLLTYPLYLNHYTLGRVMTFSLVSHGVPSWLSFVAVMATILLSSWCIMIFAEPALQSVLRKRLPVSRVANGGTAEAAPRS